MSAKCTASPAATAAVQSLVTDVLSQIDALLLEAERQTKPLELEPFRGQLFELFVVADASGLVQSAAEPNLSPESISRSLAKRWGLADAAVDSVQSHAQLSREHLSRMRLLWSLLRLWMEWQYAWSRWAEFHEGPANPELAASSTNS